MNFCSGAQIQVLDIVASSKGCSGECSDGNVVGLN